jgi:hypothetical protein
VHLSFPLSELRSVRPIPALSFGRALDSETSPRAYRAVNVHPAEKCGNRPHTPDAERDGRDAERDEGPRQGRETTEKGGSRSCIGVFTGIGTNHWIRDTIGRDTNRSSEACERAGEEAYLIVPYPKPPRRLRPYPETMLSLAGLRCRSIWRRRRTSSSSPFRYCSSAAAPR